MMIAWAKGRWALCVPIAPLLAVVLICIVICFAPTPTTDIRRDQFRMLWPILALCGGATVMLSRLTRRRGDQLIGLTGLFSRTSLPISGESRITARMRIAAHVRGGGDSKYVFEVTGTDGTALPLGTARSGLGTDPDRMGRRLSAVLGVPLAEGTPGAGSTSR